MFQAPLNTGYDIFIKPENKPIVKVSSRIYRGIRINHSISE